MLDFISFAPGRSLARSPARRLARSARWLRALALTGLVGTVPLPALAAPQAVGPPITVYNGLANLLLSEEQASVDARANGDFAVAWIDSLAAVRAAASDRQCGTAIDAVFPTPGLPGFFSCRPDNP